MKAWLVIHPRPTVEGTARLPALISIGGRPVLEHTLRLLHAHGIRDLVITAPADAPVVEHAAVAAALGLHLAYWPDHRTLQPPAWDTLRRWLADPVLLLAGEVLTNLDLTALRDGHRRADAPATAAVDPLTRIPLGIYVLDPPALAVVPLPPPANLVAALPTWLAAAGLAVREAVAVGYARWVETADQQAAAQHDWQTGRFVPEAAVVPRAWYVARTRPRAEWLAAAALAARGLTVYLPEWHGRRRRGGAVPREPLFPGYLFVRTDGRQDALLRARSAPNVVRLLGSATGPEPVPEELVEAIRERCAGEQREPFRRGQRVRLARGPFRALAAVFDGTLSGGQRARVFVQMLQRLVPVIVDVDVLRRAI